MSNLETHSRHDLTAGPIIPQVIRLAIPAMITNGLHSSYSFVNTIWMGKISPEAIAAIGIWHNFFMIMIVFNQLVGIGSTTLIARCFGAKDYKETVNIAGQTFTFKLLISIIVSILGLTLNRWAYTAYGATEEVVKLGVEYSTIMFCIIPFWFSGFTLNTMFRSTGDMKRLMYVTLLGTSLNIILDPLLIFDKMSLFGLSIPGAGLGIRGAAIGSVIAILISFGVALWFFTSGKTYLHMRLHDFFKWNNLTVWRIMRIGSPAAVGDLVRNSGEMIINRIINILGTATFAAATIVTETFMLISIPISGLSEGVAVMVGQNLGAHKPKRATQTVSSAFYMLIVLVAILCTAVFLAAPQIVGLFTNDPIVGRVGIKILRIVVFGWVALGLGGALGAAYWGAGYTFYPMLVGIGSLWILRLPFIWLAVYHFKLSFEWIFIASVVSECINFIASFYIYRLGYWKSIKV